MDGVLGLDLVGVFFASVLLAVLRGVLGEVWVVDFFAVVVTSVFFMAVLAMVFAED